MQTFYVGEKATRHSQAQADLESLSSIVAPGSSEHIPEAIKMMPREAEECVEMSLSILERRRSQVELQETRSKGTVKA